MIVGLLDVDSHNFPNLPPNENFSVSQKLG